MSKSLFFFWLEESTCRYENINSKRLLFSEQLNHHEVSKLNSNALWSNIHWILLLPVEWGRWLFHISCVRMRGGGESAFFVAENSRCGSVCGGYAFCVYGDWEIRWIDVRFRRARDEADSTLNHKLLDK